jgi:hypothetical protein
MGGSITTGPATGFLTIWSELGPIGFIVYFGLWLYALFRVSLQCWRKQYQDIYQEILGLTFISAGVMLSCVFFLAPFLHHAFLSSSFWILAALVWVPYRPNAEAPVSTPQRRVARWGHNVPGPRPVAFPRRGLQ